jgi:hypothetical protein
MKIAAAVNGEGQSVNLEKLDNIICQIIPEISIEEEATVESGMKPIVLPWFAVKDGRVQFEDASSRWFLGGRAVEGYECR